jgi:hypothetical protein
MAGVNMVSSSKISTTTATMPWREAVAIVPRRPTRGKTNVEPDEA